MAENNNTENSNIAEILQAIINGSSDYPDFKDNPPSRIAELLMLLGDDISDIKGEVENFPINLITEGSSNFIAAGIIRYTDGTPSDPLVSYQYTDYIDVSNNSIIWVYAPILTSGTTNAGVAFYDENKNYVSGVPYTVNAQSQNWVELLEIPVPLRAKYIRTASRTSQESAFVVYGSSVGKEKVNYNGFSMFEKVGVISDSISCGWALDKNGNNSRRNLGISWVQQLARRYGNTSYNLGASGVDPIEWFQPNYEFAEYCYTQYQSVGACDLYIIGLGLNGGTLGTIADINEEDYTQNASTFYGQYARIIQMINDEHPNAVVMCLTEPTTRISSYDQAVRDICALSFINAELVDLEKDYMSLFNTPEILAEHQPDGLHFTPYGYTLIADAMEKALNDYISKHTTDYKYVGVSEV